MRTGLITLIELQHVLTELLTPFHYKNLRYHLKKHTPICCGGNAELFTSQAGGGCLATLLTTKKIPLRDIVLLAEAKQWHKHSVYFHYALENSFTDKNAYMRLLRQTQEVDLRDMLADLLKQQRRLKTVNNPH